MKIMINKNRYIIVSLLLFASCTSQSHILYGTSKEGTLYSSIDTPPSENMNDKREGKIDFDQDGISNFKDQCVSLPETYNFYMDNDGCPDKFNYSDEPLEIKYVNIFYGDSQTLTSNITQLLELKFLNIFFMYPETYWILEVKSQNGSKIKAEKIKELIDKKIGNSNRTKILYSKGMYDEVFLKIDSKKARLLIEQN